MISRRLLLACLALAPTSSRGQEGAANSPIVLGTATPGGSFPAFGRALVAAVNEVDPALTIEPRITKGSTENLALLREGKLDLALVQGEYAFDALNAQPPSGPGLTVVAPIDASPGLFVVPTASSIHSVADLRGCAVALGTRASGFTLMGRTVLLGSGIDPEHDIRPILLDDAGDGAVQVRDGRAAALWGASLGWPGFKTLADAPGGARFFGPAPEAVPKILALRSSLRRLTVPAGSFKGQDAAIETVGSWSFILGRPGLDDAYVSRLVRAIDQGRNTLARHYAQGHESDPRNLVSNVPAAWLHPATAIYLREIGAVPQ
ncbi:TAXI family TRAP transporter solute-binding subunit [Methylobacterium sp. WL7]|nr:TAXI family TRAP transporter solute-binding subunit [Methylobacterium sp. WL7]TXN45653.1 TAXI family TRAP transporter solute-binding subunit [Methylobacterium sp. WL7]